MKTMKIEMDKDRRMGTHPTYKTHVIQTYPKAVTTSKQVTARATQTRPIRAPPWEAARKETVSRP